MDFCECKQNNPLLALGAPLFYPNLPSVVGSRKQLDQQRGCRPSVFCCFSASVFFLSLLWLAGTFAGTGRMADPPSSVVDAANIVLFGDSLTERSFLPGGWGLRLSAHYARKADVIARGFSGYNTRWVLYILSKMLQDLPKGGRNVFATVFLGANDACLPDGGSSQQYIDLEEYKSNLQSIVKTLNSAGYTRIIIISPPPVYRPGRVAYIREKYGAEPTMPDRTNENTGQYAAAAGAVAALLNLPFLDLWGEMQKAEGWGTLYLVDGLHFTEHGQAKAFELLQHLIDRKFPDFMPAALPLYFPDWKDIDFRELGTGAADSIASLKPGT